MFKILKDNKIIGISETTPVLLDEYEVVEVNESVSDYIQVNGEYLLKSDERAIAQMQADIRAIRDSYLVEYVDKIVSNPLRWADMSIEDQNKIKDYRRYLLDFTTNEEWYLSQPKTFDEWK